MCYKNKSLNATTNLFLVESHHLLGALRILINFIGHNHLSLIFSLEDIYNVYNF